MAMLKGPIFETNVVVGPDASASVLEYLEDFKLDHAKDVGVLDVRVFENADASSLTLQLSFESNEVLDEFLSGAASVLEHGIVEASDGIAKSHSRVLREEGSSNLPSDSNCLNCGTSLRGQYCGKCGQRSRSRLISLWELIRDAFGDLFELDSRLWQTLIPLLIRPGRLTADYLQGKRARFMPPFRMYLVLSLLFFVIAFFNPNKDFALLYTEPDETPVIEGDDASEPSAASQETSDEPLRISIDGENVAEFDNESGCEFDAESLDSLPEFLSKRFTADRLQQVCEKIASDDGVQLQEKILDNIPAALIILLPVMAFVLRLLYPLSRRYYVEHVLFFVHFHAFFFLMLSLQILWARSVTALGLNEAIAILPIVVSSFYIPIYLFKAMRRVYGQGFFLTLLKYLMLLVSYLIGFGLMMLFVFAVAAFSI